MSHPVSAAFIVQRRLAAAVSWYDVKVVFGKHSTALAEVFPEAVDGFQHNWDHLVRVGDPSDVDILRVSTRKGAVSTRRESLLVLTTHFLLETRVRGGCEISR